MRARVLSLCMRLPARRAGPPATAPALSATRRQRRKVDKCRVADKKQTDKPTNKQTNTHCSFIGIDALPGILYRAVYGDPYRAYLVFIHIHVYSMGSIVHSLLPVGKEKKSIICSFSQKKGHNLGKWWALRKADYAGKKSIFGKWLLDCTPAWPGGGGVYSQSCSPALAGQYRWFRPKRAARGPESTTHTLLHQTGSISDMPLACKYCTWAWVVRYLRP